MILKKLSTIAAVLALSSNLYAHNTDHMENSFAEALNDESRPTEDRQRDQGRKPQEIMQFAGINPGMRVLDIIASGGYYTEVLSHRVGSKGEVL